MFDKELTCNNYNNQWDITTSLTNNSANIPPSLTGHTVIKQATDHSKWANMIKEIHVLKNMYIYHYQSTADNIF